VRPDPAAGSLLSGDPPPFEVIAGSRPGPLSSALSHLDDLINAGDIDGFASHLADDFVEHEETPGLAPTKDGVKAFFRMQLAVFLDLRMGVEDVVADATRSSLASGTRRPTVVRSRACRQPEGVSPCSSSTCSASVPTASCTSTGVSWMPWR
jgi:hypothetical protein